VEIRFSPEAKDTFLGIILFIETNWNEKVADEFINKAYKVITSISNNPYLYPKTNVPFVRKAFVTKQTSILYQVNNNYINILLFWDNRQEQQLQT
jgi:plasmid stabilization system protein ParE